jgi:hypothetical protein
MAAAAAQTVLGGDISENAGAKKRRLGGPETAKPHRRRLEGYGGDSGVYLPVTPNAYHRQWKTVVSNQPAATSDTLVFDVRAAKNELIRCKYLLFVTRGMRLLKSHFLFLFQSQTIASLWSTRSVERATIL